MKRIPLTNGGHALVDDEDYERVVAAGGWWRIKKCQGSLVEYAMCELVHWPRHKRKVITLQRFVLNAPQGSLVDHLNGDGLDCRRFNLRLTTGSGNQRNRAAANKNSTTGFRGVSQRRGKWRAHITDRGKFISLGDFDTLEAARAARRAAEERLWSEADRTRQREAEKRGK